MEMFRYKDPIKLMAKAKYFGLLSLIVILASWTIIFTKGFNYGIDFAGGTLIQVKYEKKAPLKDIRAALSGVKGFEDASVTNFGSEQEVVIRTKSSSSVVAKDVGKEVADILKDTGKVEIRRVDMVGPKIGGELREKGLKATLFAILGILIYISFRFEWRFALASVAALVHDVSIALGAIALFSVPFNLDILAAILTILGYSLNDTIIVFDRIREGIEKAKDVILGDIIDESVTRTLSRTTLTSLTTFFVVLVLYLFGGEILSGFSFTLLVGVIVGTYSSIFIASPILMWLGFSVKDYKQMLADKKKREIEKDKLRNQFEQGVV
ncbi:MAG TPA: protein translocase subunit SecF [Nitratifractor sp.]|nr:protein translocase subunit SecF [Nitratifractor sp.]HHD74754.1 protein translocase subunit SecF [Nitratifractor sp.]HHH20632.1 protein translocase subunit SecF [Nitratifractor sp.]